MCFLAAKQNPRPLVFIRGGKRLAGIHLRQGYDGTGARPTGSEFFEIKIVAADAKVFDDVGKDATRHVARMPRKGDEPVGTERIGVVAVTTGCAQEFTANLTQTTVKLTTVPRGIFAHGSSGQNEFIAESGRDGTSGFEQRFQMRLGSLLESQGGFAAVAPVRVAARQQSGFGNPYAVFVLTKLHF